MSNAEQKQNLRELITGIDKQLEDAEATLLETLHLDDIRNIVERMASLKVAKDNLTIVLALTKK